VFLTLHSVLTKALTTICSGWGFIFFYIPPSAVLLTLHTGLVLKGDMSIVGPRPLLVQYLELYNDYQRRRHEVRPGLTGLAQISGRNLLDWEDKFLLDVKYVDRMTFIGDVKIIFNTVKKILKREGICSDNSETSEYFKGNI
jgi:hypothetical protein